ncbi:DapH/DapD/GlmU-related protein [Algoriphagus confluentis]|uniref:PglD N-terminal domain-containing protein n=1 Tax=Algoriphagus confluentis TaxID=1697556 RepID=A0ABQ6PNF5_9BACT|nr:hypothetical protein Aconfl_21540 [Algoriphagus confluentis]
MLIAGAGGHALEVKEELERINSSFRFVFFDETGPQSNFPLADYPVISQVEDLILHLNTSPEFVLGLGKPEIRERFMGLFEGMGGSYFPLHARTSQISPTAAGDFDALSFSFVGPSTHIGRGTLINSRAHVHHQVQVGDFCEIGPGALLLGAVKIGKKCRIGAGAILLPGVILGDEVVVGAGAVVAKNIGSKITVAGVPARPLKNS